MTSSMMDDETECTRERTLDGIYRCLALLASSLARDWQPSKQPG